MNMRNKKYLGITIQNNLKWDKPINTITAKANQSLGFIKRNLKVHSPAIKIDMYAILFSAFVLHLLLCICLGGSA
jgi:hypothetical protein